MKMLAWVLLAASSAATAGCSTEEAWSGTIADERCGRMHDWDEHAPPITERECTLMCNESGSSYVFVTSDRVHAITNQEHPGLAEHAGRKVRLTGRMHNNTLTVTGIDAP